MPSARAERFRRAALGGLLALLLCGAVACSGDTSIDPPSASAGADDTRTAQASQVVEELSTALQQGDGAAAARLGLGGARALLRAAAVNVGTLDLVGVTLRLVDDQAPTATDSFGPDAWQATVEVGYRLRTWDRTATKIETTFVFAPSGSGQAVAGIGGTEGRTPVWLTGPVQVASAPRALVVARGKAQTYLPLARRALSDVSRVLPRWRGRLVIEVPASEDALDRALGAPADRYRNIAAVTASVDGSLVASSPVHVFLNPQVFADLGPRGAQVVISHESTHVATGATFAAMPTWLLEGFADYVALAHADIPVATAASQILRRIRKEGPPDDLPSTADLDPSASGLGATYEEAWLATRFIAQEYGEAKLVAFYDAVSDGTSAARAFTDVLGTTQPAFVRRWRADLRDLAG